MAGVLTVGGIIFYKARFHKNRGTGILFACSLGALGAGWALTRYVNSIRVFNNLPQLPDQDFERERLAIAKRAFTDDYLVYAEAVESEYMESLPVNHFRFKKMLD